MVCGSRMVRVLMMLLASGLAVYTVAPAVYWHVVAEDGDVLTKWVLQCPPCPPGSDACTTLRLLPSSFADSANKVIAIAQKLNLTLADFQGGKRDMKEEVGKSLAQLLREGFKLHKEAKDAQLRANRLAFLDASKKTVYRSQKGSTSEKGSGGCAQAEGELAKEMVRANLWEKRAKDLGWKPKPGGYQKYKKYIQMLDGGA